MLKKPVDFLFSLVHSKTRKRKAEKRKICGKVKKNIICLQISKRRKIIKYITFDSSLRPLFESKIRLNF